MRNILVEIQPYNPVTQTTETYRLCYAWADETGTYVDGKEWLPVITGGPVFALSLWQNEQPSALDVSYGNLAIEISRDFANLNYQALSWSGAPCSIWFGQCGDPFSSYKRIFAGYSGPIVSDANNLTATISLLGPESQLVSNILTQTYAGTGGVEGPSSMLGNFKPLAFGLCYNVAPTLINSANQIYQVHGYGSCAITGAFENALSLGSPKSDVADYSTLYNLSLDATKGEWATCTALGLIRLGAQPTGKITADVGTYQTVGQVCRSLLSLAGVPAGLIDTASFNAATRGYSFYQTDQGSILEAVKTAALQNERYLIADSSGVWHLASSISTATPTALNADQSTFPIVIPDQVKRETSSNPVWRLRTGYNRVWSVNSLSEVAGGIVELGQDLTALQKQADDTDTIAKAAAGDAAYAKARVYNQTLDGILDRTEKLDWVHNVQSYNAEKNGLVNTANGLGVTTEATAYVNALTALVSGLESLTPAYTDTTQDTTLTIDLVGLENAFLGARQSLVNANSQRAQWALINGGGKPQDNATVGATAGVNLSDGSGNTLTTYDIKTSVGTSADTAHVGGVPSSTVLQQLAVAQPDTVAPAIPAGLTLSSTVATASNGVQTVTLTAVWNAVSDADLAGYKIAIKQAGGGYVENLIGSVTTYSWPVAPNISYSVKVSAYDTSLNYSSYSAAVSATSARDTTAPASPTDFGIEAGVGSAFLHWNNPTDADLAGILVYEGTSSDFGAAHGATTLNALSGQGASLARSSLTAGLTYYYWIRAFDTSQNYSAPVGPVSIYIPLLTVDAANLTGQLTGSQLSPSGVVSVLTAQGISGVRVVTTANINDGNTVAQFGGAVAYNIADGRLYRNGDGSSAYALAHSWAAVITPADAISGQLNGATQIASGTISGDRLQNATISPRAMVFAAQPFSAIGFNFRYQHSDNSIQWDAGYMQWQGASSGVQQVQCSANGCLWQGSPLYIVFNKDHNYLDYTTDPAIIADDYVMLVATWAGEGNIATNCATTFIDGGRITTDTITSAHLQAQSVIAGKLAASSVLAGNLAVDAVTAGTVAASAIGARELQANSITASKLAIIGDSLNPDPLWQDISQSHNVWVDGVGGVHNCAEGAANSNEGWYDDSEASAASRVGIVRAMTLWDGSGLPSLAYRYHFYNENVKTIAITAGKNYELSASFCNQSNQSVYVGIETFAPDISYKGGFYIGAEAGYSGVKTQIFTAASGATWARQVIFNQGGAALGGTDLNGYATVGNIQLREQLGGTMIVDGSITTAKLVAGEIDGSIIKTNTLSAGAIKSTDSLPATLSITGTGFSLATLSSTASSANTTANNASSAAGTAQGRADSAYNLAGSANDAAGTAQGKANDAYGLAGTANANAGTAQGTADNAKSLALNPAPQINANTTLISPGKIQLQGGTTLRNWMVGGDSTTIDGGAIAANTITANKVTVGIRGVTVLDIAFTNNRSNQISWSGGYIDYMDENGARQVVSINAGSSDWSASGSYVTYVWFDRSYSAQHNVLISAETTPDIVLANPANVILAAYRGGTNMTVEYGRTIIDGDVIKTGTVTADRMNVTSLSSINGNIGDLHAGIIRSANGNTVLNLDGSSFVFEANQFQINQPGNGVTPPFQFNGSKLQLSGVAIDGGTINNATILTDGMVQNAVTNGDFVQVNTTFYGQGGVSVSASGYSVN